MNKSKKLPQWAEWALWGVAALLGIRFLIPAFVRASGVGGLFAATVQDTQTAVIDQKVKNDPVSYTTSDGHVLSGRQMEIDADGIFKAFHLDKGMFNPASWYEEDEKAFAILNKYNETSFKDLSAKYRTLFSRDLRKDVLDLLDASYFPMFRNRIFY